MPRLIMVSGWRGITCETEIKAQIDALNPDDTVVHGGCIGADMIADKLAKERGLCTIKMQPQGWLYGKYSPLKRNEQMVNMLPDLVLIFHPKGKVTAGTEHALRKARKKKLAVKLIWVNEPYRYMPKGLKWRRKGQKTLSFGVATRDPVNNVPSEDK